MIDRLLCVDGDSAVYRNGPKGGTELQLRSGYGSTDCQLLRGECDSLTVGCGGAVVRWWCGVVVF